MTAIPLTRAHCDLLLDVFEQCVVVRQSHDQWEASDGATPEAGVYRRAVSTLKDIVEHALTEGVPEPAIDDLAEKYLPAGIHYG